MNIVELKFTQLSQEKEGIVLLGAGGDLQEWIHGVSKILKNEGIVETNKPEELWEQAIKLKTTGGRIDLVLVFKEGTEFNMSKMALWRIQFGDCSWVSDYVINYENQHLSTL